MTSPKPSSTDDAVPAGADRRAARDYRGTARNQTSAVGRVPSAVVDAP
ncbi:MAG: hypothetical protein WBA98_02340 [Gordonia sp. (in: high G+C Gram-positive bacteria)]